MHDTINENMTDSPYHAQLSECLKPLIRKIELAFITRPTPSGFVRVDLDSATDLLTDGANALAAITAALNGLGRYVLATAVITEDAIQRAITTLETPLDNLLAVLQKLWEKPFPAGLEHGQYLAAAILERPLRQLLEVLEQVVMAINNPADAAARHGTTTINLNVVFQADSEVKRLEEWCASIHDTTDKGPTGRGFGSGALLAAFLLGRWSNNNE